MSKQIVVNIDSLVSGLKIEVRQCGCCMNADKLHTFSNELTYQVTESLLKAIKALSRETPLSSQGKPCKP